MLPGAISEGNQCADGELSTAPSKRRTRKRPQPTGEHVMVPVAFNKHLGWGDAAFVLAEMLRHILFMRGQLPMPYHQLLKVLEEREERDNAVRDEKAAAAAAAAARAATGAGCGEGAPGGRTTTTSSSKSRSKSGRPLARAPAHRRARKCVGTMEETALALEEAFSDAAGKGRPVLEALILLGASHLSPREIYSITFSEQSPSPPTPSPQSKAGSHDTGGTRGNDGGTSGSSSSSGYDDGGAWFRGKSSLADAYSRKLVRSLVGQMSSVTFRGLGACRVHLFLRIADAPIPVPESNAATGSGNGNDSSSSGTGSTNNRGAPAARLPRSSLASPADAALRHLVPRPGFKTRVSRSRPAPKVSVVLSKRPPAPPSVSSQPPRGSSSTSGTQGSGGQQRRPPQTDAAGVGVGGGRRPTTTPAPTSTSTIPIPRTGGWEEGQRHGQQQKTTTDGEKSERRQEKEEGVGQQQQQQQQPGVWHQLVCARLAGLKGCDSLAS